MIDDNELEFETLEQEISALELPGRKACRLHREVRSDL